MVSTILCRNLPPEVDSSKREEFLSDEDFFETFNMNRTEWAGLAAWKKKDLKKKAKLF